jgi:exodeoxyribonuclease VII large subunit
MPAPPPRPPPVAKQEPRVLSVAQLGRLVGRTLDRTFTEDVWVEGEVSGARSASSGHVYFCMKDEKEDATIDVVLYRSQISPRGRALVKDGARVRVRGRPMYWSPRGKLQFVGDRVEPTGKGALLEALEQLKAKLKAEALFAPERKRPLPPDPRVIGVVTSAHGAVIHDVCKVAFRRGGARILLAPASVQGAGAAESIRQALRMLQRVASVDVIIVGRGGGSQDDLSAFNDEMVVREVAACRVPVVSAVGHEVDVTLVDFAADARAATPSQAAEMVVPDGAARRRLLEERSSRLLRAMQARIAEDRVALGRLAHAFGDPRLLIASAQQRVDAHVARLGRVMTRRLAREREDVSRLSTRLGAAHPRERIARDRARASEISARLGAAGRELLRERSQRVALLAGRLEQLAPRIAQERSDRLAGLVARLDAMSPLKVLARGYAIVTHADGRAVRAAREVAPGDALRVRVAEGTFEAEVTKTPNEGEP